MLVLFTMSFAAFLIIALALKHSIPIGETLIAIGLIAVLLGIIVLIESALRGVLGERVRSWLHDERGDEPESAPSPERHKHREGVEHWELLPRLDTSVAPPRRDFGDIRAMVHAARGSEQGAYAHLDAAAAFASMQPEDRR